MSEFLKNVGIVFLLTAVMTLFFNRLAGAEFFTGFAQINRVYLGNMDITVVALLVVGVFCLCARKFCQ